jgi:O-glycosyl hydrolase
MKIPRKPFHVRYTMYRLIGCLTVFLLVGYVYSGEIKVDPLVRYQKVIGVGGSCVGNYTPLITDMGMNVHRLHLDPVDDFHVAEAQKSAAVAAANGKKIYHIASLWSPPGDMKIGPYYTESNCVSGANMCGGTLNPAKYAAFADWLCGRLDRFKNAGVPLYAICLQNEPWLPIWYISCTYDIVAYLAMFKAVAPVVKSRHPDVQIMAAEMFMGSGLWERPLVLDSDAAKHLDILAWHGMIGTAGGTLDATPNGAIANWWKGRHNLSKLDNSKFRSCWQTENNQICGWEKPGGCSDQFGSARSSFEEACNMLCMFRYGHGQVWTNYGLGDLKNERYIAFKHFGRYLEPGAEMINCTQDTSGNVASVAFHHVEKKTLTVVLIKGGTGSAQVKLNVSGVSTGAWFMSDPSAKWANKGNVSNGQTITVNGFSVSTICWENYNPAITTAVRPLDAIGKPTAAVKKVFTNHTAGAPSVTEYYDLQGKLLTRQHHALKGSTSPCMSRETGLNHMQFRIIRKGNGAVMQREVSSGYSR